MPKFIPRTDDPIMNIEIGKFKLQINQRYVQSLSIKKRRHFWAVIDKKIKEENKNGNTKKCVAKTN